VKELVELLKKHKFFKALDKKDLQLISGCGSNVVFKQDELIFEAGGPANEFYLIRSGKVAVELNSPQKGPLVIQTLQENDVLGFSWLFEPFKWGFDSRAIETVRATKVDGVCLRTKCDQDPRLGYQLTQLFAKQMTSRLQATRMQLLDVYGSK
jgi:CRP/FNR family transcriptional regulator, cyclic AMP receptor protein